MLYADGFLEHPSPGPLNSLAFSSSSPILYLNCTCSTPCPHCRKVASTWCKRLTFLLLMNALRVTSPPSFPLDLSVLPYWHRPPLLFFLLVPMPSFWSSCFYLMTFTLLLMTIKCDCMCGQIFRRQVVRESMHRCHSWAISVWVVNIIGYGRFELGDGAVVIAV